MEKIMKKLSKENLNDTSHLVIAFICHGSEGEVELGQFEFRTNRVEKYLNKNQTLKGKPKIFIMDCCQGGKC